jgi:hypothetical protein
MAALIEFAQRLRLLCTRCKRPEYHQRDEDVHGTSHYYCNRCDNPTCAGCLRPREMCSCTGGPEERSGRKGPLQFLPQNRGGKSVQQEAESPF